MRQALTTEFPVVATKQPVPAFTAHIRCVPEISEARYNQRCDNEQAITACTGRARSPAPAGISAAGSGQGSFGWRVLSLVRKTSTHPPAVAAGRARFEAVQEDIYIAEASDFGPHRRRQPTIHNPTERPDPAGFGERGGQWEENRFDNPPRLDAGGDLDDNEEESGAGCSECDLHIAPARHREPWWGQDANLRSPGKGRGGCAGSGTPCAVGAVVFPWPERIPMLGAVILPPIRQG